jgi:AcrR family transcriptional regulator
VFVIASIPTVAHLGGGELRDRRHVAALLDGPGDGYTALPPFVVEGLAEGERAILLIDPRDRAAHLEALERLGVDTRAALDDGSLKVEAWADSYLLAGRFEPAAMVEHIRGKLADGRRAGFARTRMIGFMEWGLEDGRGASRIIEYEARLEAALRGLPDLVVCAYDIERHAASVILETIVTHPVALIGGVLRPGAGQPASPRERILAAASELFTRQGPGETGVDALIAAAGVAKATFYRHFPAKDDLIVAWLRDPRTRWLDRLRVEAANQAATPVELVPAFFHAVTDWLASDGRRGCPYLDAAVSLRTPSPGTDAVIREYLAEVEAFLRDALVVAGRPDADVLARQLQTTLAGGITLSAALGEHWPAMAARDAAVELLGRAPAD